MPRDYYYSCGARRVFQKWVKQTNEDRARCSDCYMRSSCCERQKIADVNIRLHVFICLSFFLFWKEIRYGLLQHSPLSSLSLSCAPVFRVERTCRVSRLHIAKGAANVFIINASVIIHPVEWSRLPYTSLPSWTKALNKQHMVQRLKSVGH